jgi:hypothetical protein
MTRKLSKAALRPAGQLIKDARDTREDWAVTAVKV